uniref:Lactate utilization protein n=1 Tax=Heligmosomoides polygyrus TaxID=6339 RepID=A0A183GWL1_HELPZ
LTMSRGKCWCGSSRGAQNSGDVELTVLRNVGKELRVTVVDT